MDLKNVTADSMRAMNKQGSVVLDKLLKDIYEAAESGGTYMYWSDFGICNVDKRELERRGFVVEIGGRYNETNTRVSW